MKQNHNWDDQTPLRRKRRNAILETAETYFIENSISGASMENIAQNAGISRQTLYRYYSSKDELAFAVEIEVLKKILGHLRNFFTQEDAKGHDFSLHSLYTSIDSITKDFITDFEKELKFTGVFDTYYHTYPDCTYSRRMKEVLRAYPNPFTELIIKEQKNGNISRDENPLLLGETISNSLLALCQRILLRKSVLTDEFGLVPADMIPTQMKLLIRGLYSQNTD